MEKVIVESVNIFQDNAQSCLPLRYSEIGTGVHNVSHDISHEVIALQGI